MKLSVCRDGVEIGEWTEEEVQSLLADGQLVSSDYYWKEGMSEWSALGSLMETRLEGPRGAISEASQSSERSNLLAILRKCEIDAQEENAHNAAVEKNPLSPADKGLMRGLFGFMSLSVGLGFRSLFEGEIGGFLAGLIAGVFFFSLFLLLKWFVRRR